MASVKPDFLTCLECGARQKTLKRDIGTAHDLTPDTYRAKWDLPKSYPMVAPDYTATRSEMAKRIGLGRKPGEKMKPGRKAAPKKTVTGNRPPGLRWFVKVAEKLARCICYGRCQFTPRE